MNNKKILIAVVALVAVVAVMVGIWFGTRPEAQEGDKTITVTVVHKNGAEKKFTYHTDEEYLGDVLLAENLVEGEESTYGLMISTVDGETADYNVDQGWWQIFIGEESATLGADSIPIKDGDTFKLVYTIG